jgi:hypothetical protein
MQQTTIRIAALDALIAQAQRRQAEREAQRRRERRERHERTRHWFTERLAHDFGPALLTALGVVTHVADTCDDGVPHARFTYDGQDYGLTLTRGETWTLWPVLPDDDAAEGHAPCRALHPEDASLPDALLLTLVGLHEDGGW